MNILKSVVDIVLENGTLSIGRVLLLSLFILSCIRWFSGIDVPEGQIKFLMILTAYVLSSKVLVSISDKIGAVKEIKSVVEEVLKK